jgi:hypothetical protein
MRKEAFDGLGVLPPVIRSTVLFDTVSSKNLSNLHFLSEFFVNKC